MVLCVNGVSSIPGVFRVGFSGFRSFRAKRTHILGCFLADTQIFEGSDRDPGSLCWSRSVGPTAPSARPTRARRTAPLLCIIGVILYYNAVNTTDALRIKQ